MDNVKVGTVEYVVSVDTKTLRAELRAADKEFKSTATNVSGSGAQIGATMQSIAAMGAAYLGARGLAGFLQDSIDSANRFQSSMIGLSTISNSFGISADGARQAAQELSSDGLVPLSQSAQALRNLLASGFSLKEATQLLKGLKDQAAFNRQSFYDLGGAVVATTEGIRNGNSVLADATGTTKNLSVMAKEAGVGIDQMGSISQNTAYRQAVLSGFLNDTSRSMGDAARYAQTAAGMDIRLAYETEQLRVKVGQLANMFRVGVVGGLTRFIASNQDAIITIGSGVAAFAAFAIGGYAVVRAITAIRSAILALSASPFGILLTIGGILAGLFTANLMSRIEKTLGATSTGMEDLEKTSKGAASGIDDTTKSAQKLAEQLAEVNDNIAQAKRDYLEQLSDIVRSHQNKVRDLKKQITEEDNAYKASNQQRLNDFRLVQEQEAKTHFDKVKSIQGQINVLTNLGRLANQQDLADLQSKLDAEKNAYNVRQQEKIQQFDEEATKEKEAKDLRIAEMQDELTKELALLKKHADSVRLVRNVQQLDEIDRLKRSHREQLIAFDKQKNSIIKNANDTASGIASAFNSKIPSVKSVGGKMGNEFADALKSEIKAMFKELPGQIWQWWQSIFSKTMDKLVGKKGSPGPAAKAIGVLFPALAPFIFRAKGGPVTQGSPYIVGEKGPEMFVPNRSGTIIPNHDLASGGGSGSVAGQNVNVTVNVSGIAATSRAALRDVGMEIVSAVNEGLRAKGAPQLAGGKI